MKRDESDYPIEDGQGDLAKPWAMVGRVAGDATHGDGEPVGAPMGEAIVRLCNWSAHVKPEAFDGVPPINLAIGYPFVPMEQRAKEVATLGGIMLHPGQARALGQMLIMAADRAESTTALAIACGHCGSQVDDMERRSIFGAEYWQVLCGCGMAGPVAAKGSEAVALWNAIWPKG